MDLCVFNQRAMGPAHVENLVELGCRMALAYHGVSHITIPVDVQEMPDGSLLVSDDMAGRIYRISYEGKSGAPGLRTGKSRRDG